MARVRGIAASAGVWLRAIETEISAALSALVAREGSLALDRCITKCGITLKERPRTLLAISNGLSSLSSLTFGSFKDFWC